MNKFLMYLVTALSLGVLWLPGTAHAASGSGDYIALAVPDVRQAVMFFHDVMNCNTLSGADSTPSDSVALLDCGRQTVVELTLASVVAGQLPIAPERVTLTTDDATNVAAWLRANRIHLLGKPLRVLSGANRGKIAVSFLTPWDQPLELVSRISANDLMLDAAAPAAAVATQ